MYVVVVVFYYVEIRLQVKIVNCISLQTLRMCSTHPQNIRGIFV